MKKLFLILVCATITFHASAQDDKPACKDVEPTYLNRFEGFYISDCQESEYKEPNFVYYPPGGEAVTLLKGGHYKKIYYWKKSTESRKLSADQIYQNYYNAVLQAKGKKLSKMFFTFSIENKEVYLMVNAGNGDDVSNYNIEILIVEEMEQEIVLDIKKSIDTDGKALLYGIFFDVNESVIKPESESELLLLITYLEENPTVNIIVVGHTDNTGDFASNLKLSKERGQAVVTYLISKGISASRLSSDGVGSLCPVTSNETEEGRKKNRRVEIVLQ
ncbi:MAG: OmpA family protein [Crocinitomicaceae bacterium]|nr:OmpA family protein [Crocinitomicaceae bacterium]MBK8927656.1 OmpA family protein [Crocinitomicaceae bacterium]